MGVPRTTVLRAIASNAPSGYERRPVEVTAFTPFEAQVRGLLAETPEMPATVVAERVGWNWSLYLVGSWLASASFPLPTPHPETVREICHHAHMREAPAAAGHGPSYFSACPLDPG